MLTSDQFILFAGLPLLALLLALRWRQGKSLGDLLSCALFGGYLLLVTHLTLFPIPLPGAGERSPISHILGRINLVPLRFGSLFDAHPNVILHNLLGNILLTAPFGFGASFVARVRPRQLAWLVLAPGLAIESAQLLVSLAVGGAYRGVDINDVLLNALGALLGYAFFYGCAYLVLAGVLEGGMTPRGPLAYLHSIAWRSLASEACRSAFDPESTGETG